MKKRSSGRKYIDENKVRIKREAEMEIPDLIEFGDEADLLAKAKIWNPKITAEELADLSRLFRAAKRERARGQ